MYKRLVIGYCVGFGLGLLFTGMFFEFVMSPLDNPITVGDVQLDWVSLVTTWKYLGLAWLAAGVLLFLVVVALEKRSSGSGVPSDERVVQKEGLRINE